MINYDLSREIFLKIYPNEKLCEKIENYIKKHETKFNFYVLLCKMNVWSYFFNKDPFLKLALVYAYLPITKHEYDKKGISENIFYSTMDDIRIWIDDHKSRTNEDGLFELNWIWLHLSLNIFKLGRLQFQKCRYYDKTPYNKNGKNIKFGDKVLNIHIPRGGKLDVDECKKSVENAKSFFKKYYPKYDNDKFICHSWLLYGDNSKYMNENSNILKFAKMFDVVSQKEAPEQAILWLFGNKVKNQELIKNKNETGIYLDTNILNADTDLQKSAIEYINRGGTLGDAFCVLK